MLEPHRSLLSVAPPHPVAPTPRNAPCPPAYHRAAPSAEQLDRIFRLRQERVIGQDWVVHYEKRWFQLQRQSGHYAPARGRVQVYEAADGKIAIEYRGREFEVGGDSSTGEAAGAAGNDAGKRNREDAIASRKDDSSGGPSLEEICR